ncbi:uncharacterized protein [Ptychodera flava]|uniref:uncharacterized protein n=1 Tax=Ptychodera flava TaxID=63121 RepID=UPI00396A8DB4
MGFATLAFFLHLFYRRRGALRGQRHGERNYSLPDGVWYVLIMCLICNFVSGMAVGILSQLDGATAMLALMSMETLWLTPLEICYYRVMSDAGMGFKRALFWTLQPSFLAPIGLCVGVATGDTKCWSFVLLLITTTFGILHLEYKALAFLDTASSDKDDELLSLIKVVCDLLELAPDLAIEVKRRNRLIAVN